MTYSVRMTLGPRANIKPSLPIGSHAYLSVNGRSCWKSKKTAQKHRDDVACNPMFTEHYSAFDVIED